MNLGAQLTPLARDREEETQRRFLFAYREATHDGTLFGASGDAGALLDLVLKKDHNNVNGGDRGKTGYGN